MCGHIFHVSVTDLYLICLLDKHFHNFTWNQDNVNDYKISINVKYKGTYPLSVNRFSNFIFLLN